MAVESQDSKGIVVLAVGLPGSGKTTWFTRHGITPLSTDLIRKLLLDDENDQSQQQQVFGALFGLLRRRLSIGRKITYVDATNLNARERSTYFKIAAEHGYAVDAIFFDVPVEVCQARNAGRSRVVPLDVMHTFAKKLEPPAYAEGFHQIVIVNREGEATLLARDGEHSLPLPH